MTPDERKALGDWLVDIIRSPDLPAIVARLEELVAIPATWARPEGYAAPYLPRVLSV
jgi:alpha-galactosidase